MKLKNVGEFTDITPFIEDKLNKFSKCEKTFENLYLQMFSESKNVMAEISDGFRVKKITYGECEKKTREISYAIISRLESVSEGSLVGIYMDNSVEWIQIFWAVLMSGYNPILLNARLPERELYRVIREHNVCAVITDSDRDFPTLTVKSDELIENASVLPSASRRFGTEVIFMSSGTTENVKLCSYTAENFYYQVLDSYNIVRTCPQMKKHYNGELKLLALLPFYHIFGFIAIYLWFGFFQRTFVFLKDLSPRTLLYTIKKHEVTHIFAVPLVWERVYKEAIKTIRRRGEKTYDRFMRTINFVNTHGLLGTLVARKALREVREGLFGDSISFLISGGSAVSDDVLKFFNGIGYHIANGYGMTEIGITSVEISTKRQIRNLGSVGAPFGYTEYAISERGTLTVRGKTMASKITVGDSVYVTDPEKFFDTLDLASVSDGRYYIKGRCDDLIIGEGGENLNPELLEKEFLLPDVKDVCLISGKDNEPTLILSVKKWLTPEAISNLEHLVSERLARSNLSGLIKTIVMTSVPLLTEGEFKKSRKKQRARYLSGEFIPLTRDVSYDGVSPLAKKIRDLFGEALGRDGSKISHDADFFVDLGATSLDYFSLLDLISEEFEIDVDLLRSWSATTVDAFTEKIKNYKDI